MPSQQDEEGVRLQKGRRVRPALLVFGVAGLLFTIYLMDGVWPGLTALAGRAGMALAWVVPLRFVALGFDARGWWNLFPKRTDAPSWWRLALLAVVRDGINNLLPVVRVGGEMVAVRLLRQAGVPGPLAAASVVVEVSVTLIVLIVLTFAGLGVLLVRIGAEPLVTSMLLAAILGTIVVGAFLVLQMRVGLAGGLERLLARLMRRETRARPDALAHFDRDVMAIYERFAGLARCAGWQLLGLAGGMVEMWWVMRLVQVPISLGALFILESLVLALQSLSFAVPAALGVQEGGFVILGAALGLAPDVALLLALVRRTRQIVTGLPALLLWRWQEARVPCPQVLTMAESVPPRRA